MNNGGKSSPLQIPRNSNLPTHWMVWYCPVQTIEREGYCFCSVVSSNIKMSDLEKEFSSLKEEFVDLKIKIETLVKKYSNLETKYEKSLSRKSKASFKCRICDQECENLE